LIVLGVIIVGIAIVVGINMFQTSAVQANRDAVITDINNLAAAALQHYKKPTTLGGGGQFFDGFTLATAQQSNSNGAYRVGTAAPTTKVTAAPAAVTGNTVITAGSSTTTMYIAGYGVETGNDGTNLVHVYATVTGTGFTTSIVN
jgi:Tfp pilus assembly protein PilE